MKLLNAKVEVYSNDLDITNVFNLSTYSTYESFISQVENTLPDWEIVDYEDMFDFLVDSKEVDPIYWDIIDEFSEISLDILTELVIDKLAENKVELVHIIKEYKSNLVGESGITDSTYTIDNGIAPIHVYVLDKSKFTDETMDDYINVPTLYFNKATNKLVDTDLLIPSVITRIINVAQQNKSLRIDLFDYINEPDTSLSYSDLQQKLTEFINSKVGEKKVEFVHDLVEKFTAPTITKYRSHLINTFSVKAVTVETDRWINSWMPDVDDFSEFSLRIADMFKSYSTDTIRIIKCPILGVTTDYIFSDDEFDSQVESLKKSTKATVKNMNNRNYSK